MNKKIVFSMMVLCLIVLTGAEGVFSSFLAKRAKKNYEDRVWEIEKEYEESLEDARKEYKKELKKAFDKAMEDKDLEEAIRIKEAAEMISFEEDPLTVLSGRWINNYKDVIVINKDKSVVQKLDKRPDEIKYGYIDIENNIITIRFLNQSTIKFQMKNLDSFYNIERGHIVYNKE